MDGSGARQAIIDIGSNTVRLVIYGGPLRAPEVLYNEKVTARLGRGLGETGRLSDKAMTQALSALARYALLLQLRGVKDVSCVATAAVRDATNGAEFLQRVAQLGLCPRLLSGEEEAVIGAGGVCAAFPAAAGVVGDLGGGSLELTDIAGDRATHGVSLPLGTLRLARLRVRLTSQRSVLPTTPQQLQQPWAPPFSPGPHIQPISGRPLVVRRFLPSGSAPGAPQASG